AHAAMGLCRRQQAGDAAPQRQLAKSRGASIWRRRRSTQWTRVMPSYRLYILDAGDRFRGVEVIEAPSDAVAVLKAQEIVESDPKLRGYELWDRARPVHRSAPGQAGARPTGGRDPGMA